MGNMMPTEIMTQIEVVNRAATALVRLIEAALAAGFPREAIEVHMTYEMLVMFLETRNIDDLDSNISGERRFYFYGCEVRRIESFMDKECSCSIALVPSFVPLLTC